MVLAPVPGNAVLAGASTRGAKAGEVRATSKVDALAQVAHSGRSSIDGLAVHLGCHEACTDTNSFVRAWELVELEVLSLQLGSRSQPPRVQMRLMLLPFSEVE